MAHKRRSWIASSCAAWKTPELDDVKQITAELEAARAERGGPLLYLSVIGPSSIRRGDIRDELVNFYHALLANCDSVHIVIEGTEFQQSIKRSVIANVLLVVPARGRVFIENSLQGVVAASPANVRVELANAAQTAGEQRLFDFARQA